MDAIPITSRNVLFLGIVAAVVFVFAFLSSEYKRQREPKRLRIKAIVYSDPNDPVFRDLQKGISDACQKRGFFLDYVDIADDLGNMDVLVADHVLHDDRSDAFIVRIPGPKTAEALRRRGRDHVSVLSAQTSGQEVEFLGYLDTAIQGTAVLVHANLRVSLPGHISATAEDVLDKAMEARKNGVESLVLASPQFSRNPDIMDILRSMGFKSISVMEPRGDLLGSRSVDALERSFSER